MGVPVTTGVCPRCGGDLEAPTSEPAWVTDLPEAPQPQVTEYRVAGRRLLATAHLLHYGLGVPQRKLPAILPAVAEVQVTQSALAQDAPRRAAGEVGTAYQQLRTELRDAPAVHTDDTGWRVGGGTSSSSMLNPAFGSTGTFHDKDGNDTVPNKHLPPPGYILLVHQHRRRSPGTAACWRRKGWNGVPGESGMVPGRR